MIVKKHFSQNRLILAACDASLLDKKIENSTILLDLSSSFYKGEKTTKEEFIKLARQAFIINAVGQHVVNTLIEEKIIQKEDTKEVQGVPFVQVVFNT